MKKLIVVILIAFIIFIFTPQGVSVSRRFISSHAGSSWAPSAQYHLASLCFWTLRHSEALGNYQAFLRKYRGNREKRAMAMFRVAICYERTKGFDAAIAAFEKFIKSYPSHKNVEQARHRVKNLRALF